MLIVNKNANNTWILTLNETKTLSSPYYLVKATSRFNNTSKTFILSTDQSSYTDRFNQFTVTESSSEVLTSGTVEFTPTGQWDYEIYEQTSSTNLSVDAADNTTPIERGVILVIGTNQVTYKKRTQGITYKGYGG